MTAERQLRLVETQAPTGTEPEQADRAPSLPPPDPLIGRTLDGRYRIEAVLGEGGMGLVYRARHVILDKPLAIKVLRAEVSRDEEVMKRFRQEAQSASAIGNHHIIEISDFGSLPDNSTYFVMEFLDGVSLTKAIELQNPMPAERVVHVARQLCEALGAAHERSIVHRDLKPDNIYLVKRGKDTDFVKVLDFGIAKVGGSTSKLTKAGQVFGTPHYMSPEQCAGSSVDQRTDIYALGVILYEMASGRVPFDADNLMGILTKHMYEQPIPPHELPPPVDVPPGLEAIIMKCLVKSADVRYQTMLELKEDLERLGAGTTPNAVGDAVMRASGNTQPFMTGRADGTGRMSALRVGVGAVEETPAPKSKAPIFAALGVVVLAGLAVGGYFAMQPPPETVATTLPVADPPPVVPPPVAEPPPVVEPPPAVATAPPAAEVVPVRIESTPPGAEVLMDGAVLGVTPLPFPRPTGAEIRTFTLRLTGYVDGHVAVMASSPEAVAVTLDRRRTGGRSSSGGSSGSAAGSSGGTTAPAGGSSSGGEAGSSGGRSSSGGGHFTTGDAVIDPWGH